MPKLIRDGQLVDNPWTLIRATDEDIGALPSGPVLLPLTLWNAHGADLLAGDREVGLWLASDQLPDQIQGDLDAIPVIAVEFPVFADGRGFSIGRLLRERYGFSGELRAVGAPIRDQLSYLRRCGFNAFELAEHYDPEQALASLQDFTEFYQSAVDQKVPKFRRFG